MTEETPADQDTVRPESSGQVDRHLLELLVCPVSLGPLRYDREHGELISEKASLAFPIRGGIPIMLEEEARVIEE